MKFSQNFISRRISKLILFTIFNNLDKNLHKPDFIELKTIKSLFVLMDNYKIYQCLGRF